MYSNLHHSSRGYVLVAAMMIVILLSGISVGMIYMVDTEGRLATTDLENTIAFYGAEAAMEKMMADLNALYAAKAVPSVSDIQALEASSYHPVIANVSFPAYSFDIPVDGGGNPVVEIRNISAGPNEGLVAYLTKMTPTVIARGTAGAEVKMEREMQVAQIPVFQFGMFSETDLAYFPGPGFDFGGRVHTNGNLFMCTASSSSLTFFNKMTAVKEVIRAELPNGLSTTTTGRTGSINIPTAPGGCDGGAPACRDLDEDEGSKVGGPASSDNTNWPTLSLSTYNSMILDGDTGAKRLDLPFVAPGLRAIEIIRRPPAGEDPNSLVAQSRLYNVAQIRVIISDVASENPGGAGIHLANMPPYYLGANYGDTDTAFAEGRVVWDSDFILPPGLGIGQFWPLIDGWLKVEALRTDGNYYDVTLEWLNLGIARENPDAILKFQKLKDDDGDGSPDNDDLDNPDELLALNMYDTREGEVRDQDLGASDSCAVGGIMNVVELDVGNLKRWLEGATGSSGTLTDGVVQNGYILYHSDRRGMLPNPDGDKVGEYGYEDTINPSVASGAPNGSLDAPEDVNENGLLDTYGAGNLGGGFGVAEGDPTLRISCNTNGRKNRVIGPRRALKLINGALGNVPTPGFTVASENIVYIQGHYNANASGFGDPHSATAVIADAASFLSKDWQDCKSMQRPTDNEARVADTTYYRVAVAAGKNIAFPSPGWTTNEDYGLDGGTHNFLRYLETWSGKEFWYKGSLVSLYYSEYATGIYKCCTGVYGPPVRKYSFDDDFLDPAKLPPGTPKFRDMVNVGFRQIFQPD